MSEKIKINAHKLGFARLALVDWLMEDPKKRFVLKNTSTFDHKSLYLYSNDENPARLVGSVHSKEGEISDLLSRLGGSLEIGTYKLKINGILFSADSNAAPRKGGKNNFQNFISKVGLKEKVYATSQEVLFCKKETAEWWNDYGRDAFLKMKAKKEEERAKVERTILIGTKSVICPPMENEGGIKLPAGMTNPLPSLTIIRPAFTATVIKETEKRVYIEDIVDIRGDTGRSYSDMAVIHGNEPNQYVDRDSIMIDEPSDKLVNKLVEIDETEISEYFENCRNVLSEIINPLINLNDRLIQSKACREDLIREAIEEDNEVNDKDNSCRFT